MKKISVFVIERNNGKDLRKQKQNLVEMELYENSKLNIVSEYRHNLHL